MLFNSGRFVLFLCVFLLVYYPCMSRVRLRNAAIVAFGYVFYGSWDWRFLALLMLSTLLDYFIGLAIYGAGEPERKRRLVTLSVTLQLTLLGIFKYFNFFADNGIALLSALGLPCEPLTWRLILPVGVSFYTFQSLTYTIGIYRGRVVPTRSLLDFTTFVTFWPQLVAGPIERAEHLLPQVQSRRHVTIERVEIGFFLLLWGYFKKVVVADNLAQLVAPVFANPHDHSGANIVVAVLAFTFQIYGDFSGYTDIARGIAHLMGFDLMLNFRLPYFATNPSDFWSRWHISLSTWLRDYLYIPLGGNRQGARRTYRNLFLTMLLGGLWHGAAWHFVIWGALHGAYLMVYRLIDSWSKPAAWLAWRQTWLWTWVQRLICFVLVSVAWVFFRAASVGDAVHLLTSASLSGLKGDSLHRLIWFVAPLLVFDGVQHITGDLLVIPKLRPWLKGLIYTFLATWILLYGYRKSTEFIYFQF